MIASCKEEELELERQLGHALTLYEHLGPEVCSRHPSGFVLNLQRNCETHSFAA